MLNQKTLIGGIIGGIVGFLAGALIWGMLLKSTLASMANPASANCMRPDSEMIMWAMAVSCLLSGILMAWLFSKCNIGSVQGGATFGAIYGILGGLAHAFGQYSMSTLMSGLGGYFVDAIAMTIWSAIVGAAVGWWMGRK